MHTALAAHIKKYVSLTADDAIVLGHYTKAIAVKKKDLLLKEGQLCKTYYFVAKGCLRLFFIDEKGTEQTVQFAIENWWLTDYSSFGNRQPSQFYIQAVEHSNVIGIDKTAQDELLKKLPQLES